MLGVVRVYSRKVNYLFQDCSEALVKIKQVFVKDRDVDLPEGAETAPTNTITLPENYDDLELFFEPDAAAGLGHGASGSSRSASSAANRVDITLEDPDAFDDGFEEQYAYDDRIVGDDDDDFIDDEIDTELRPTPGFRTPGSTAPRPFGETDPNERVDVQLEDYDEADVGGGFGPTPGGSDDDGGVIYRDDGDDDIAPLPLDDDLEDENGVRGTVVGFKTPPPGSTRGGAEGKENAPNSTSTVGVAVEWGKTAQKANRPGPEPAKRAKRKNANVMKVKFDRETMLSNARIKENLKDASDLVAPRTPGVLTRVAEPFDDDTPFGADEDRDANGKATIGYYRDAYESRAPPEGGAERRAMIRGVPGGRDPLMGHRLSRKWAEARERCVAELWKRAGERWGAGVAGVEEDRDRERRGLDFDAAADDDGGDFPMPPVDLDDDDGGFGGGGFDGDDAFDLGGSAPGSTRRDAARATLDALGSEPPTPANAPTGSVDWSAATKRMLADIAPRLRDDRAPTLTVSEMTTRRDGNNAERRCDRGEAARVFYQVLVLKTHGFVEATQGDAYGDIEIFAGPKLGEVEA